VGKNKQEVGFSKLFNHFPDGKESSLGIPNFLTGVAIIPGQDASKVYG